MTKIQMQIVINHHELRIKELKDGLEKLISQCEQVDSWESFPSSWIDEAYELIK